LRLPDPHPRDRDVAAAVARHDVRSLAPRAGRAPEVR